MGAARLREHVEFLASDRLRGRATPSPGLDAAADYIAGEFERLGLDVRRQRFVCGSEPSAESENVVAIVPGALTQAVMVTAHYDHLGARGDAIYNGANDNASGTAGVLAIAGAVRRARPPPRRTLVFVAFCGEELGLRGSSHYVDNPAVALDRVSAVVNLEMLGRPLDPEAPTAWVTGASRSNFIDAFRSDDVPFGPASAVGPGMEHLFEASDNYAFAKAGVVAHSISTGRLDELYHSPDDDPETLDYDAMARIVSAVAEGVLRLAGDHPAPVWLD